MEWGLLGSLPTRSGATSWRRLDADASSEASANKVLRAGEERGVLRIGRGRIEVFEAGAVAHLAQEQDPGADA